MFRFQTFFQMIKIDELPIGRLQQTHYLQSSKHKDGAFEMSLKIISGRITVTYQNLKKFILNCL